MLRWRLIVAFTLVAGVLCVAAIGASPRAQDRPAAQPASMPAVPANLTTMKCATIDGRVVPLGAESNRPSVVIFIGMECPISRWYIPALNDLSGQVARKNVDIFGVISDRSATRAAVSKFVADYHVQFPLIFDASGELAKALLPRCTPEAIVMDAHGTVVYRGRIDDSYSDVSRKAQHVDHHEMLDAVDAVSRGVAPAVAITTPIGCQFEGWDARAGSGKITYARNVAPILYANCASCHHQGAVAPFSLTDFDDAADEADQIALVTRRGIMPPWKPAPGYGDFQNARVLSDGDKAILADWAASGMPRGNDADLPPVPTFKDGWSLGKPDMVLKVSAPFDVPAGGRDVYRVFVIPLQLADDVYVAGVDFRPSAPTVVHHALFFLDTSGKAMQRQQQNTDGKSGYASFGGVGFSPSGGLGGWAPGASPTLLPTGIGRLLKKGSDLVLQVHYHPDGKPHQDQSQLALYLAKGPVTQRIVSFPLMTRNIDIPAGDDHYTREIHITLPFPVTVDGITPHMHLLGREMKATATKPDGTVVPLIWIKDWDFRWQDQYRFKEPIHLPVGTKVDVEAVYDNSAANPANPSSPPKRVHFGEQTTDEMCICFVQLRINASYAPANPGGLRRLLGQLRQSNN